MTSDLRNWGQIWRVVILIGFAFAPATGYGGALAQVAAHTESAQPPGNHVVVRIKRADGSVVMLEAQRGQPIQVLPGDRIRLVSVNFDNSIIILYGDDVIIYASGQELEFVALVTALDHGATLAFADDTRNTEIDSVEDLLMRTVFEAAGAPAFQPLPQRTDIIGTRYAFFDRNGGEEDELGLYSYAILPRPFAERRNMAFLAAMFESTPVLSSSVPNPAVLNVIYIPTKRSRYAVVDLRLPASLKTPPALRKSAAEKGAMLILSEHYAYDLAADMLDRFCIATFTSCNDTDSAGPYLITLSTPFGDFRDRTTGYLFVDLTSVHPKAFGEFLKAFKAQVRAKDFTDRQKLESLRLGLLNLTLEAADWINPIAEGVAEIMGLVWPSE